MVNTIRFVNSNEFKDKISEKCLQLNEGDLRLPGDIGIIATAYPQSHFTLKQEIKLAQVKPLHAFIYFSEEFSFSKAAMFNEFKSELISNNFMFDTPDYFVPKEPTCRTNIFSLNCKNSTAYFRCHNPQNKTDSFENDSKDSTLSLLLSLEKQVSEALLKANNFNKHEMTQTLEELNNIVSMSSVELNIFRSLLFQLSLFEFAFQYRIPSPVLKKFYPDLLANESSPDNGPSKYY